jgi:hypothetical protein
MLERVESEVHEIRRVGSAEDAKDTAFVMELVEHVRRRW